MTPIIFTISDIKYVVSVQKYIAFWGERQMTRLSQCAKVNTLAETTQETVKKKKKKNR